MEDESKLILKLLKEPEQRFKNHLDFDLNERIIFSGKFGHGKTTFLQHFFKINNQYNVVRLFPVNYSVASNEDIFKYIKYDIIYEMLQTEISIQKVDIKFIDTLPLFLKKNIDKVAAAFIRIIPKVGKDIVETYDSFKKLFEEFEKTHQKYKDETDESTRLLGYLNYMQETEGTIFENDIVTRLIENILTRLKEKSQKQNVLLIDDLDRLDPEHIFRLLNVFASHFDTRTTSHSKNKFGFDKIIIVCDIENVRNIFKTKYGGDTDFNGYIDKFYSTQVFSFSNRFALKEAVKNIIWSADWRDTTDDSESPYRMADFVKNKFLNNPEFLIDMLDILLGSRQINLRNILKLTHEKIVYADFVKINSFTLQEDNFPIILYLRLLTQICGDRNSLKEALQNSNPYILGQAKIVKYTKDLLYILTANEHKTQRPSRETTYQILFNELNIKLILDPPSSASRIRLYKDQTDPFPFTDKNFIKLAQHIIDLIYTENNF